MVDHDLGPEVTARVREAVDMLEVVGEHVRLRRRGHKWEGLCPFHEERTPSFSVDPDKGLFYCFGCHQGGDVITFVMRLENLGFPDAVEQLAGRYGVQLPPRSPETRRRQRERDRVRGILEEAQHFFVSQLGSAVAASARRELERRGFGRETWAEFGFGFAPDDWRQLLEHLTRRHPCEAVVDAGLAVRPEDQKSPYDRFRNRITFPIRSADGQLVAFGGRALGDGEPKYLNSPEGPLFVKRSTLFGLDRARRPMASGGTVVIVEGYFDCLTLHRVGLTHVVATLGTALTAEHATILRRLLGEDGRALLCYDADIAGRRAAATGARVLLEHGVEVAIVPLAPGQDPDDVVREQGADAFRSLLEAPVSLLAHVLAELPDEPSRRRLAGLKLAPLVSAARNPATRRNLLYELSRRVDLSPGELEEYARSPRRPEAPARSARPTSALPGERYLLRILLECSPEWRQRIAQVVRADLVVDPRVRRAFEVLDEIGATGEGQDFARALMDHCDDPGVSGLVAELCNTEMPDVTEDTIRSQLRAVLRHQARAAARRLAPLIEDAERRGNGEELARLMREKARLRRCDDEF